MAYSWSDPNPSNVTAAGAQAQFNVPQANIGTIVAALLKQKNDEENRKEQQMQDLIKGIGSAAVGYQKGQNAGAADDSANAALYGMQNPGDPMGGYTDPNRVPDYGGTDAMKAYLMQQKATPNPLDDQLTRAKINAENALGHNRWTYPQGSGSGDSTLTPRQDINTASDAQKAAGNYYDSFGLSDAALNDQSVHAPSDTPSIYSKGAPATTVPQGQLLVVDPKDGSYHYVTQDYLDQARAAQTSYQNAQAAYRSKLGVGSPAPAQLPPPNAGGGGGIRQADVDQAAQAQQQESQYPVGTHARAGSTWYVKTAQGWAPDPNFSQ